MPWSRHVMVTLTVVNGLVAIQTLSTWPVQRAMDVSYPLWLHAIASGIWFIAYAWLSVGLFRRSARTLRLVAPVLTAYGTWSLLTLLAFASNDYDRGRAAFQLVVTLMALIPFWWWHIRLLMRTKPAAKTS